MKVIGIDIGTTSISSVVMDSLSGEQIVAKTLPNNTNVIGELWANEQNAQKIYEKCRELIEEYTEKWSDIAGIGLTGQMHGIVYLDKEGTALSNLYTWEDERGNLIYHDGFSYAEYLEMKTGYPMSTGFGLTTHFYNQLNGLVPAGAYKICTIMDYVAMKLCRRKEPLIHPSNAASLGLFDIERRCFDTKVFCAVGIDVQILPEVLKKEEVIGETETGIPVIIPIGDNQAGILGVVSDDNDVVLNIGTSSQISTVCSEPEAPVDLECRPYVNDKYIMLGAGLCGGISFSILNDFFCQVCHLFSDDVPKDKMFRLMMEAAEGTYQSRERLRVNTLFRGKRNAPHIRGSIQNINMSNLTPGNLVLGFYQGVCEEMYEAYKKMSLSPDKGKLLLSGNALRNNRLLRQVCKDTFQREVYFADQKEEAAVGASKLAIWTISRIPQADAV